MDAKRRQATFDRQHVWTEGKNLVCSFAKRCGWTNNPFLTTMSSLNNARLLEVMESDWTRRVEASINLTPYLWRDQCYKICQFTNGAGGVVNGVVMAGSGV